MRADSYGHHRTVGLCRRLMFFNGELKVRQERQQGSGQQKVFAGAGTWGGSRGQLHPKLARLLRSPRALCRNVSGWKAGEDLRFWEPTSGLLLLLPPLWGTSYVSRGSSLSSGQGPPPHTLIMTMPRALTLSPRAPPLFRPRGGHLQRTSSH